MSEIAAEMLEMLERLQWAGERDPWDKFHVCPVCFANTSGGHDDDCELAALIAKATNLQQQVLRT